MDFDFAHYMLTDGRKHTENPSQISPSRLAYRKLLADALNLNRTRILAFKNKSETPIQSIPKLSTPIAKPPRHIPQV